MGVEGLGGTGREGEAQEGVAARHGAEGLEERRVWRDGVGRAGEASVTVATE